MLQAVGMVTAISPYQRKASNEMIKASFLTTSLGRKVFLPTFQLNGLVLLCTMKLSNGI